MSETPQILLAHHLKKLKLPTFLREHEKIAPSVPQRTWTTRDFCCAWPSWS